MAGIMFHGTEQGQPIALAMPPRPEPPARDAKRTRAIPANLMQPAQGDNNALRPKAGPKRGGGVRIADHSGADPEPRLQGEISKKELVDMVTSGISRDNTPQKMQAGAQRTRRSGRTVSWAWSHR